MPQQLIEPPATDYRPQHRPRPTDYAPFGNVEARNGLQQRLEIPLMLRALRLPPGGRVLEVGCGRGVALPVLADRLRPQALVGVDIDPEVVAIAEERLRMSGVAATVVEGDVRDLPFDNGTFDLVIDFGTCYHIGGGTAGTLAAFREIARVLRPGGKLVHETRIAQHLAHPVRSLGRRLPWRAQPLLVPERSAVLWAMRRRI